MGTYTNVASVKSLFRRIKIEADTGLESTNTVMTTEEVDTFIDDAEVIVTARLATCYDMTSVGSESVKIIGTVVKFKVAQVIKDILQLTTNSSDSKTQDVTGNWEMRAKELLNQICPIDDCGDCKQRPTMPLPDTPILSDSAPEGGSRFATSTNSAQFTKGNDNW